MSRIFYIMGKSASGKDSIYREIMRNFSFEKIVMYTTRPMRAGEQDGVQYHFTDMNQYENLEKAGKVIEARHYQTMHGPWVYYTVDDGSVVSGDGRQYLMIGTLESYEKMKACYGSEIMVPIYIEVPDELRLTRAIAREKQEKHPDYSEVCRRYLADENDFSEEKIRHAGITVRFCNMDFSVCLKQITDYIRWKMTPASLDGEQQMQIRKEEQYESGIMG